MFWIRGRGRDHHCFLCVNIFSLTVPKDFAEEPIRVSLISGIEESYA